MAYVTEIHLVIGLAALFIAAFLFKTRHRHTWKLIRDVTLYDDDSNEVPRGHKYISQCTTCGKLKSERL